MNNTTLIPDAVIPSLLELPRILSEFNGAPIFPAEATLRAHLDAGGVGVGARIHASVAELARDIALPLSEKEMLRSSSYRELRHTAAASGLGIDVRGPNSAAVHGLGKRV